MNQFFETSQKPVSMSITVNEALRLKNEISGTLNSVQGLTRYGRLIYGELIEDGLRVEAQNSIRFEEYKDRYYALLNYSNEINTQIARFNAQNNIGFLVRQRSNLQDVEALLNQAATESKAYERSRSNYVEGVGRVEIETSFEPFVPDSQYVAEARSVRDAIRDIDNEIARLNSGTISLSFSFSDVDDIRSFFRL
jgi:hypothetical protein